eukprot:14351859-Alexandrium_andersonii.AAC.1
MDHAKLATLVVHLRSEEPLENVASNTPTCPKDCAGARHMQGTWATKGNHRAIQWTSRGGEVGNYK